MAIPPREEKRIITFIQKTSKWPALQAKKNLTLKNIKIIEPIGPGTKIDLRAPEK